MLVDAATARRLREAVRLVLTGDQARPGSKLAVAIQATDTATPGTRLVKGHLLGRAGSVATLASAVHGLLAVIAATGRRDEASNA
jgi:hypothetical protein